MANRFPLIVNPAAAQVQELASGDNLDLTGNGIVSGGATLSLPSSSGTLALTSQLSGIIVEVTEATPSANTAFTIDSWTKSENRAVKYLIGVTQGTALYQVSEILVLNDGSTGQLTEFGLLVNDASKQVTYDADFFGSTVLFKASTPTADTPIKFVIQKTVIAV